MEVKFHAFLTLALDGAAWLASNPGHITSGENVSWYLFDRMLCWPQSQRGKEKNWSPIPRSSSS